MSTIKIKDIIINKNYDELPIKNAKFLINMGVEFNYYPQHDFWCFCYRDVTYLYGKLDKRFITNNKDKIGLLKWVEVRSGVWDWEIEDESIFNMHICYDKQEFEEREKTTLFVGNILNQTTYK